MKIDKCTPLVFGTGLILGAAYIELKWYDRLKSRDGEGSFYGRIEQH